MNFVEIDGRLGGTASCHFGNVLFQARNSFPANFLINDVSLSGDSGFWCRGEGYVLVKRGGTNDLLTVFEKLEPKFFGQFVVWTFLRIDLAQDVGHVIDLRARDLLEDSSNGPRSRSLRLCQLYS